MIGFQALLKHLQMLWTYHCSQLVNPEAAKAITYTIQLFLVALLSDPVSSVFNIITDTSVTCWFLWSELFKASAFNEESKDKKHHTHKNALFLLAILWDTWAKKLLSFEERKQKQGENIVTISLQAEPGWFLYVCAGLLLRAAHQDHGRIPLNVVSLLHL